MYRDIDYDIINKNLSKIEDKAKLIYATTYEPTLEENKKVYQIIKDYIKDNDLIVYGGYAQNAFIKKHNENETFYKDTDIPIPDIEFYTPEPFKDLINLCDILNKNNFKHIEGKGGVHNETYKIFVNFHPYVDFSYMPKNIFDTVPTIKLEGIKMTHPHFMMIDAYRVYTDPMTSFWRLKKTFSRMTTLMKYYPFDDHAIYNIIEFENIIDKNKYDEINKFIRKKIIKKNKLIMIGFHSFNRLMKKAKMKDNYFIQENFYQLISTDYNNDRDKIYKLLKNKFKDITFKKYYPYFQFLDKTSEFYYKDKLILRLYGNNEKCIVYNFSKKKNIHYGTFQLLILFCLIYYNIGIMRKNTFIQKMNITMINRLFKARDTYLEKKNLTLLDDSPFKILTLKCIGETIDGQRQARLLAIEKRKQGKPYIFSYRPSKTGSPGKIPNFKFSNSSGERKMS